MIGRQIADAELLEAIKPQALEGPKIEDLVAYSVTIGDDIFGAKPHKSVRHPPYQRA